jgi:hypothetical protein
MAKTGLGTHLDARAKWSALGTIVFVLKVTRLGVLLMPSSTHDTCAEADSRMNWFPYSEDPKVEFQLGFENSEVVALWDSSADQFSFDCCGSCQAEFAWWSVPTSTRRWSHGVRCQRVLMLLQLVGLPDDLCFPSVNPFRLTST